MGKDKTKTEGALATTTLTKDRDTKSTFVYKDNSDGAAIPSLYIKKSAFNGDAPEQITVTITAA